MTQIGCFVFPLDDDTDADTHILWLKSSWPPYMASVPEATRRTREDHRSGVLAHLASAPREAHALTMAFISVSPSVLLTEQQLQSRVQQIGAQIRSDYADNDLVVVGILTGSFIFMADLIRAINIPLRCDFLGLSSYGSSTESSGTVTVTKDLVVSVEDRDVLVVEDIIDTGLTMAYLLEDMKRRKPASVKIASLLSKPARRQTSIDIDYLGFTIEDRFVVGYGLDFDGRYRNLPYIGTLD